jgi:D-psicose/D-tagatose/L-ribulose 3-epimerase
VVKMMRFGICTGVENLEALKNMGFDYLEWSVNTAALIEESEFLEIEKRVRNSDMKCEAFNCLFPWDIRIVGPDADEIKINEYIKKALERISRLGAERVVVGSGGPRNIPDGWECKRGYEQFAAVLQSIGCTAIQYSITAVVEPLNKSETNLINNIDEGLKLVEEIKHPNVKLLADFYHMRIEKESMERLKGAGAYLKHIHIANSNGRIFPSSENEDEYACFFKTLKKAGYDERISIEGATGNLKDDAVKALKVLRKLSSNSYQ